MFKVGKKTINLIVKIKNYYIKKIYFNKTNIQLGKNLIVFSRPSIRIDQKAQLVIGDNVTLNSNNKGYHVNMYAPIKLLADREGAIIKIGSNTRIHGSCNHAGGNITIWENCLIAANCQIFDSNGHETLMEEPYNRLKTVDLPKGIIIEDNVWIGANSILLPGRTIGEGSVIAAGSVVTIDAPPHSIVGGNPAKRLKQY